MYGQTQTTLLLLWPLLLLLGHHYHTPYVVFNLELILLFRCCWPKFLGLQAVFEFAMFRFFIYIYHSHCNRRERLWPFLSIHGLVVYLTNISIFCGFIDKQKNRRGRVVVFFSFTITTIGGLWGAVAIGSSSGQKWLF